MLSSSNKTLILDLAAQKITLREFDQRYSVNICDDSTYVLRVLEKAAQAKDAEAIEYMCYLRGFRREVEPLHSHGTIFRHLLLEDWHSAHEFIIDALEMLNEVIAIPVLCERALGQLPTLDSLDNESVRKRCVYAIAKIGGESAVQTLLDLSDRGTGEVRTVARRKLEAMLASD